MFRKTSFLAAAVVFTLCLVSSGWAQGQQSRPVAAIQPAQLAQDSRQPAQLPSGASARSLSFNRHTLLSAPASHLKEDWNSAGPTASGKNYSSAEISKANFLGSTAAKPWSQPFSFGITGVDARKLWSSNHPSFDRN